MTRFVTGAWPTADVPDSSAQERVGSLKAASSKAGQAGLALEMQLHVPQLDASVWKRARRAAALSTRDASCARATQRAARCPARVREDVLQQSLRASTCRRECA